MANGINKSELMKAAWAMRKNSLRYVEEYQIAFAECLRRAWVAAKRDAKVAEKNAKVYQGQYEICINGCWMTVNTYTGEIVGNTYKARETLKKFGMTWNPYERLWELKTLADREPIQNILRAYA